MFNCPKCFSEQTQKASLAYISEAKTISPPQKKKFTLTIILAIIAAPFLLLLVGYMAYSLAAQSLSGIIIPGGLLTFTLYLFVKTITEKKKYNETTYPHLLAQWNKNFICLRCGTVFEPQNQERTGSL